MDRALTKHKDSPSVPILKDIFSLHCNFLSVLSAQQLPVFRWERDKRAAKRNMKNAVCRCTLAIFIKRRHCGRCWASVSVIPEPCCSPSLCAAGKPRLHRSSCSSCCAGARSLDFPGDLNSRFSLIALAVNLLHTSPGSLHAAAVTILHIKVFVSQGKHAAVRRKVTADLIGTSSSGEAPDICLISSLQFQ